MNEPVSKRTFAAGVIECVILVGVLAVCTVRAFTINADAAGYMLGALVGLAFLILLLFALASAKVRS